MITLKPTKRMHSVIALTLAGVLGVSLGAAGIGSYALWRDRVAASGSISSGYEYFAAGLEGEALPPDPNVDTQTVTVPSGWEVAAATTLLQDESVAVVFETQSLSQGNKGLRYAINEPPSWGDGVFGDAAITLYWVGAPEQCAIDVARPASPEWVNGYESNSVSADYSNTTAVKTEYWCLLATIDLPILDGKYRNTATVTGTSLDGIPLSDEDTWFADLSKEFDEDAEASLPISFTYDTYRPHLDAGRAVTPVAEG